MMAVMMKLQNGQNIEQRARGGAANKLPCERLRLDG